jgi:hypothetical protein
MMTKKFISVLLTFCLMVALLSTVSLPAGAIGGGTDIEMVTNISVENNHH